MTPPNSPDLAVVAGKLDIFATKVRGVMDSGLSAASIGAAIGLLVSLHLDAIEAAADHLRAAQKGASDAE